MTLYEAQLLEAKAECSRLRSSPWDGDNILALMLVWPRALKISALQYIDTLCWAKSRSFQGYPASPPMKKILLLLLLILLHPFNGLFSSTIWVSCYQKGKTGLDLNEARDDGVLWCSCISWTICKQSAPRSRIQTDHTNTSSVITPQRKKTGTKI